MPPVVDSFVPKALILLAVCVAVVWLPVKRSRLGLSIYAVGSSELSAFRTGVNVKLTKIVAYGIAGLFAGMGGLVLTASTGIGAPIPGPYLLASVAAVVLGGVVLGRRAGRALRSDRGGVRPAACADDPDVHGGGPERDHHRGGHDHGGRRDAGRGPCDEGTTTMSDVAQVPVGRRIRTVIRDYPLVPLIVLLILLIALLQVIQPGILNQRWAENLIRFAIPLAMLAACQTLTMLTGGIDLSAGTAATVSAFVVATQTPIYGPWIAMLIALVPAILIGVVNGIGIGVTRVHPLIMTLGTGLIAAGCLQVYQRTVIASGSEVPEFLGWLGTGKTWIIPNVVFVFVPLAAAIIFMLRRTGFGRLLYALGENENAARLSGVRSWQVYLSLYALSGLLAGITGLVYVGIIKAPSLSLVEPRLLPGGGGGGDRRHVDLRRAGDLFGHHRGGADPDGAGDDADGAADAGRHAAHPVRGDHPGGDRHLHPHHGRQLREDGHGLARRGHQFRPHAHGGPPAAGP